MGETYSRPLVKKTAAILLISKPAEVLANNNGRNRDRLRKLIQKHLEI